MRLQRVFLTALMAASTLVVAGCPAKDASSASDASSGGDAGAPTDGSMADGDSSQEPACWTTTFENARAQRYWSMGDGTTGWIVAYSEQASINETIQLDAPADKLGFVRGYTDEMGRVTRWDILRNEPAENYWGFWQAPPNQQGIIALVSVHGAADFGLGVIPGTASHARSVVAVKFDPQGKRAIWNTWLSGSVASYTAPGGLDQRTTEDGSVVVVLGVTRGVGDVALPDGNTETPGEDGRVVMTISPDGALEQSWTLPDADWPSREGRWGGWSEGDALKPPWRAVFAVAHPDGGAVGTVNGRLVRFLPDGTTRPFDLALGGSYDEKLPWGRLVWEPGQQSLLVWKWGPEKPDPNYYVVSATRFDRAGHRLATGLAEAQTYRTSCHGEVKLHPLVRSNGEIVLWGTAIGASLSFGDGVKFGGGGLCGDVAVDERRWSMVRFNHDGKVLGGFRFPRGIRDAEITLDNRDGLLVRGSTGPALQGYHSVNFGCGPSSRVKGSFLVHYRADVWPEQSAGE